jgi:hypothetical protein
VRTDDNFRDCDIFILIFVVSNPTNIWEVFTALVWGYNGCLVSQFTFLSNILDRRLCIFLLVDIKGKTTLSEDCALLHPGAFNWDPDSKYVLLGKPNFSGAFLASPVWQPTHIRHHINPNGGCGSPHHFTFFKQHIDASLVCQ